MQIDCYFKFDATFGFPRIAILLDNQELYRGDVHNFISVTADVSFGSHKFVIDHHEKHHSHYNEQNDRHVYIEKILFDETDLDYIEYNKITHRGRFYPDYEPSYVRDCARKGIELPEYICPNHYLGHNGQWVLDFEYPCLDWIINELRPSGLNLEDTMFSTSDTTLEETKKFFNL